MIRMESKAQGRTTSCAVATGESVAWMSTANIEAGTGHLQGQGVAFWSCLHFSWEPYLSADPHPKLAVLGQAALPVSARGERVHFRPCAALCEL